MPYAAAGPLDLNVTQDRLSRAYEQWREDLLKRGAWFEGAVPPHLIQVTAAYCEAPLRLLFYGQETRRWGIKEGQSFDCFVGGDCSVEQLLTAYAEFNFAANSSAGRSPLWRAFREVQDKASAGLLWGNLCKVAFETTNSYSFLRAPSERKAEFIAQQADLLRQEIQILQPHAMLFVTGPNYDHILHEVFEVERIDPVRPNLTPQQLGRVVSRFLPASTFRTYHPGFLNRDHRERWRWLGEACAQITREHAAATAPDSGASTQH